MVTSAGGVDVGGVDDRTGVTEIGEGDAQTLVEERHLLEPCAKRLVLELDGLEDVGARPERDGRAGLVLGGSPRPSTAGASGTPTVND